MHQFGNQHRNHQNGNFNKNFQPHNNQPSNGATNNNTPPGPQSRTSETTEETKWTSWDELSLLYQLRCVASQLYNIKHHAVNPIQPMHIYPASSIKARSHHPILFCSRYWQRLPTWTQFSASTYGGFLERLEWILLILLGYIWYLY
jgi:hypothetical protein